MLSKASVISLRRRYIALVLSINMDIDKVDDIIRWPHHTTVEELKIILGMTSFYTKDLCDYAKIVVSMTDKLKAQAKTFF